MSAINETQSFVSICECTYAAMDSAIISQVQKNKTSLIFKSISKSKRSLIQNLKLNSFPRPTAKIPSSGGKSTRGSNSTANTDNESPLLEHNQRKSNFCANY